MTDELDLLVKACRLRGRGEETVDIGIRGGMIHAIEGDIEGPARTTIVAQGNLATESFVNPHLHLDKVFTLTMLDDAAMRDYHGDSMGKAMTAIEQASRVKENYEQSWILENVRTALRWAAMNGNTHIRAFADVDTKAKLEGVKALIQAREEFRGTVELQVVAFPQDGVVRDPGAAELIRAAMELGADLVGGIPWIEYSDKDARSHIDQMFAIAVEFEAGISMLVDDAGDPGLRTLEMMAIKTLETSWQGRVLAHHARAMALYPKPYFQKLAALLAKAKIAVVSDPHTGPLHARVKELRQEKVVVCLGQDDISDAYYPYGQNNMLEVAFLASHLLWMTTREDMEVLYDMVTVDAAAAMGIEGHTLQVGSPANLAVLRQPDVLGALRFHQPPMAIIVGGKLLEDLSD
ncbi:MAG: amidohydrolase family protein [Anaerolineae bacterium]|nr:MAG: amidohydrolase family protein [Anaerolineae bacterium]